MWAAPGGWRVLLPSPPPLCTRRSRALAQLYAVDSSTGDVSFTGNISGDVLGTPALGRGGVFVATRAGQLYCFGMGAEQRHTSAVGVLVAIVTASGMLVGIFAIAFYCQYKVVEEGRGGRGLRDGTTSALLLGGSSGADGDGPLGFAGGRRDGSL